MATLNEVINSAREGNPSKFESLFEEIITERLNESIGEMRADIVAEMFGVVLEDEEASDDQGDEE